LDRKFLFVVLISRLNVINSPAIDEIIPVLSITRFYISTGKLDAVSSINSPINLILNT